jgi:hypothetical protein
MHITCKPNPTHCNTDHSLAASGNEHTNWNLETEITHAMTPGITANENKMNPVKNTLRYMRGYDDDVNFDNNATDMVDEVTNDGLSNNDTPLKGDNILVGYKFQDDSIIRIEAFEIPPPKLGTIKLTEKGKNQSLKICKTLAPGSRWK